MRERIAIILNDVVKLAGQGGGLFVGKLKIHTPDMGWRFFPDRLSGGMASWHHLGRHSSSRAIWNRDRHRAIILDPHRAEAKRAEPAEQSSGWKPKLTCTDGVGRFATASGANSYNCPGDKGH